MSEPTNRGGNARMKLTGWLLILCLLPAMFADGIQAATLESYAANIAQLIAPAKLATLGPRGANPRVQKIVYWLESARSDGQPPEKVTAEAVRISGMTNAAAIALTENAMLRNLKIAGELGCLDKDGLAEMRRGKSPTVKRGPYAGDKASVDHIIPRDIAPELDCVIANLELLPLRLNESKNDKIGARQRSLAKEFFNAGLLKSETLAKIENSTGEK